MIRSQDNKICLVRHKKNGKTYWLLPGGGQSTFETATSALQRELLEELNLKAENFNLAFIRESISENTSRHIQFMIFEVKSPNFSSIGITGKDERIDGFDFFSKHELDNIPVYPDIKNDIVKYIEKKEVPLFNSLKWIS